MISHRVIDVVETLAGREGVVGINAFESTDGQKHSDGGAESKKGLWVEGQLWVINGDLERRGTGAYMCYSITILKKCL